MWSMKEHLLFAASAVTIGPYVYARVAGVVGSPMGATIITVLMGTYATDYVADMLPF